MMDSEEHRDLTDETSLKAVENNLSRGVGILITPADDPIVLLGIKYEELRAFGGSYPAYKFIANSVLPDAVAASCDGKYCDDHPDCQSSYCICNMRKHRCISVQGCIAQEYADLMVSAGAASLFSVFEELQLSEEQKEKISTVRERLTPQITKVSSEWRELRSAARQQCLAILTGEQRKTVENQ